MHNIIFWLFAALALSAALMVISAKNPVRAVLSLIVTFLATAVTWLILEAEFLSITLILVYVGAVMVLLLFVVMMLDISFATLQARFTRWLPIGIALALGLFFAIAIVLRHANMHSSLDTHLAYGEISNTQLLGNLVFTKYLLQFEVAGVILLVAIVAAISLIFRGPQQRRVQHIRSQVRVNPKERIRLENGN